MDMEVNINTDMWRNSWMSQMPWQEERRKILSLYVCWEAVKEGIEERWHLNWALISMISQDGRIGKPFKAEGTTHTKAREEEMQIHYLRNANQLVWCVWSAGPWWLRGKEIEEQRLDWKVRDRKWRTLNVLSTDTFPKICTRFYDFIISACAC